MQAFASRENAILRQRPMLLISYTQPTIDPCDLDADGSVDAIDLGLLLGAWGACGMPTCAADVNADASVDEADLEELLLAWMPAEPCS